MKYAPSIAILLFSFLLCSCTFSEGSTPNEQTVTKTSEDGFIQLIIPPGALPVGVDAQSIQISAQPVEEITDPASFSISKEASEELSIDTDKVVKLSGETLAAYRLEPSGIEFSEPVAVKLLTPPPEESAFFSLLLVSEEGEVETLDFEIDSAHTSDEVLVFTTEVTHFSSLLLNKYGVPLFSTGLMAPDTVTPGQIFDVSANTVALSNNYSMGFLNKYLYQIELVDFPIPIEAEWLKANPGDILIPTDPAIGTRGQIAVKGSRPSPYVIYEHLPEGGSFTGVRRNATQFVCVKPGVVIFTYRIKLLFTVTKSWIFIRDGKEIGQLEDVTFGITDPSGRSHSIKPGHIGLLTAKRAVRCVTATTPSPTPTPVEVGQVCPPSIDVFVAVADDPGGHAQYINMPENDSLTIRECKPASDISAAVQEILITGVAPWVTVSGDIDERGDFFASGSGTVAGYGGIAVSMSGSLADGMLNAEYSMGVNGGLPGGQAITYTVQGQAPQSDSLIEASQEDVDQVRQFAAFLESYNHSPDVQGLAESLHPEIVESYGEAACLAHAADVADATLDIEVVNVYGLATWEFTLDGVDYSIPDVYTVDVIISRGGESSSTQTHFGVADGSLRWFTDCGDPLE